MLEMLNAMHDKKQLCLGFCLSTQILSIRMPEVRGHRGKKPSSNLNFSVKNLNTEVRSFSISQKFSNGLYC